MIWIVGGLSLREAEREPRLAFLRETAVWVLGFGETRAFTTPRIDYSNYLNRFVVH